ncbi:sulfur carrier protein ThiS [Lichenibacterium ramalinae]|uniref:Sulfur carrier protein ThiS n=1 Tax=Lichenibacterium ramalinae TaxID=2316527 RepID=A0A4Q2RHG1_9HYPH|nr:sulfur carrier protein ThiS [Lichenibacterium ramalinae]RYB06098.1 sulfur carrier protein ThiS [Lichenibacterium ramalinae]
MKLMVNGEDRDTEARTLAALWSAETEHLEPASRRGFAIALNGEVVRAARWDETTIDEGDRVEIIRAVAGG